MTRDPKISILIPTWNNLPMLQLCLQSIAKHSQSEYQIVLHINEGADGTRDWAIANRIDHTYSTGNVGICRALNLAADRCRADYLVYLNDDMYVLPGWDRAILERIEPIGIEQPAYVSGTLVQSTRFSPSNVIADFGTNLKSFDEKRLLDVFHSGELHRDDWNGATWPPSCIHRKWWDAIGGYSEELSPGFYSDIDFSMKLWQFGCRNFLGVGTSLVYHFGEKTTSQVRGQKSRKVKQARVQFLQRWGILPSTFSRFFIQAGESYQEPTPEPQSFQFQVERMRLWALSNMYRLPLRRAS